MITYLWIIANKDYAMTRVDVWRAEVTLFYSHIEYYLINILLFISHSPINRVKYQSVRLKIINEILNLSSLDSPQMSLKRIREADKQ